MSDFPVTIAIAICSSLHIYVLSAFAFSLTCLLSVLHLFYLRLLYLGKLSIAFAFFVACSVYIYYLCLLRSNCVCYALVSCLIICVFCDLFCQHQLSIHCLLDLYLLCLDKLFTLSTSSLTRFVYICCLYLVRFFYICYA